MKTYDERVASVQQKLQRKNKQRKALMATTGALCICLVLGFVIPYFKIDNDVRKYAGSEYFNVINAINRDLPQFEKSTFFDDLLRDDAQLNIDNSLSIGTSADGYYDVQEDAMSGASPNFGANVNDNTSVEITDHQVTGVYEGDLIKRSEKYIFYLNRKALEIYPIDGEETELLGKWQLDTNIYGCPWYFYHTEEMYLSEDATRLIIIGSGMATFMKEGMEDSFVRITMLDVSDPENIKELKNLYITGITVSSRIVGDQMLLIMEYWMHSSVDFDDITTFVPHMGTLRDMVPIPADSITVPSKLESRGYTLVALFDKNSMEMTDIEAFMASTDDVYVANENIYTTRRYTKSTEIGESMSIGHAMTDITCMSYGEDGLTNRGTFSVAGTVKNQYSMDEHNGILRIVTSTNLSYRKKSNATDTLDIQGTTVPVSTSPNFDSITNANLTCFEVGSWKQVAQVKQFAPEGETAESVRFDGDYAYVCTAVVAQLTDPVFFFDMSDLNNIKVKDTGTIDGYSSSLVQLKDGYLLGIGYDNQRCLKVEIYEETETGVASVCVYTKPTWFDTAYKAYYIDRENNLFGIPTDVGYILLWFDGYELHELAIVEMEGAQMLTRGVVIEDYLYVFSEIFRVTKIQ